MRGTTMERLRQCQNWSHHSSLADLHVMIQICGQHEDLACRWEREKKTAPQDPNMGVAIYWSPIASLSGNPKRSAAKFLVIVLKLYRHSLGLHTTQQRSQDSISPSSSVSRGRKPSSFSLERHCSKTLYLLRKQSLITEGWARNILPVQLEWWNSREA